MQGGTDAGVDLPVRLPGDPEIAVQFPFHGQHGQRIHEQCRRIVGCVPFDLPGGEPSLLEVVHCKGQVQMESFGKQPPGTPCVFSHGELVENLLEIQHFRMKGGRGHQFLVFPDQE